MSDDAIFSSNEIKTPEALLEPAKDPQPAGEVIHPEMPLADRLDPVIDSQDTQPQEDTAPTLNHHESQMLVADVPFPEHLSGTNNTDNDHDMANEEDALRTKKAVQGLGPWTSEDQKAADNHSSYVGDKYEREVLANKEGMESEAFLEYMNNYTNSLLKFGKEIIAHQEEFGEALSPNQELFKAVATFIEKHPEAGQRNVGVNTKEGVRLMVGSDRQAEYPGQLVFEAENFETDIKREYWMVEPWKVGSSLGLTRPGDYVVEESKDNSDGFDRTTSTKIRQLTLEDGERLIQLLSDFDEAA